MKDSPSTWELRGQWHHNPSLSSKRVFFMKFVWRIYSLVLRLRQAFIHWLSTTNNQNSQELIGQWHPNHSFSFSEHWIELVLLLSVLSENQVSGHKLCTLDNPSTWECYAQVRTPYLYSSSLLWKCFEMDYLALHQVFGNDLWKMCEWIEIKVWEWNIVDEILDVVSSTRVAFN